MSDQRQSWHLSKSIPLSFIIALIGQTMVFVWWASSLSSQVESNTTQIKNHMVDSNLHMPVDRKIEMFVPRVELDQRLDNIERSLSEIKQDIKRIKD